MLLSALAFSDSRPLPRVLLVEDHADTRQMYAEFLGFSFQVIEARDGSEALARVAADTPDVVITDISLPGMSGFDLASQIRRSAARHIPIVCLSGHGGSEHEARARLAGCDRIIQKPCLPDDLARTIVELLSEPRDRSES